MVTQGLVAEESDENDSDDGSNSPNFYDGNDVDDQWLDQQSPGDKN